MSLKELRSSIFSKPSVLIVEGLEEGYFHFYFHFVLLTSIMHVTVQGNLHIEIAVLITSLEIRAPTPDISGVDSKFELA